MSRVSSLRAPVFAAIFTLLSSLTVVAGGVCAQVGEPRRVDILPPARVSAPPPRRVAADLSARPRQEFALPAVGPSRNLPRPEERADGDRASRPQAMRVYDRNGRLIPGALQVGPDRILDPRTGRRHDVRGRGDDLQVVPGG
ncbi:hypothetical protein H0E84_04430 [Luteimonas sp. SJ-92]|uniref:Uncharacterized protein n=1 Tax=Luteimonas salinisoli TaxID=2752307 RepID=A0A853JAG6_9GAMM|nr:hypothetical protein [Luteimonas salinisoli]NZA25620.1 hypothetical protein [Luteimonas salinisoli]